jgi:hypothetical protein
MVLLKRVISNVNIYDRHPKSSDVKKYFSPVAPDKPVPHHAGQGPALRQIKDLQLQQVKDLQLRQVKDLQLQQVGDLRLQGA